MQQSSEDTTVMEVGTDETNAPAHYDTIQRIFHWSMAFIVILALALGLWSSFLPAGIPLRRALLDVHKSLGMTALVLILPRIAYRLLSRVPAEPSGSSRLTRAAASCVHILLYALMLGMPIAGYAFSAAGGYSLPWFGLFAWPRLLPHNLAVARIGDDIHVWGAWVAYAAVCMHIAAVCWHEVLTRDSVLVRMLPAWGRIRGRV